MPERARASSSPSVSLPIVGPSEQEVAEQIEQAREWADVVEFRLDLWDSFVVGSLPPIDLPTILTLRSSSEGGDFSGSEEERRSLLARLFKLQPEYIDLELTCLSELAHLQEGKTKIIGSVHGEIPPARVEGADYLKVVTRPEQIDELFDLFDWADTQEGAIPLCMGRFGPLSRLLGMVWGTPILYAALDGPLGEIRAQDLCEIYGVRRARHLMGVIGDPVDKSPGPKFHNKVLQERAIDALYLPIPLRKEEVALFLERCQRFDPIGLSVTMPLKESIFEGEVVNTLRYRGGEWEGCNTDGVGALEAIGDVEGQRMAIIGAGGAAQAIASEGRRREADAVLFNRTPGRSGARPLHELESFEYDVLVQATPIDTPIPIEWIREGSVVLEILSRPTRFLEAAKSRGAVAIPGREMYIRQAEHQLEYWFGDLHRPS